jgi:hypothetical protein
MVVGWTPIWADYFLPIDFIRKVRHVTVPGFLIGQSNMETAFSLFSYILILGVIHNVEGGGSGTREAGIMEVAKC